MKVVAVLDVDLEQTPIGTRSRLRDSLAGQPLLRRTVERILSSREVNEIHLLAPSAQVAEITQLVSGLGVQIRATDDSAPPYRHSTQRSRKWSLDGWRGGIGGTTWMDEYVHVSQLLREAERLGADAVWTCPAAAPLISIESIDEMIKFYGDKHQSIRLVFMQSPPGWSGAIFQTQLLRDLHERQKGPSWLFSYKPDFPVMDLALKDCCLPTPQAIRHAHGRLMADTERSWRRLERWLATETSTDAQHLGQWLMRESIEAAEPAPCEVEIELTTERTLPGSRLLPSRDQVGLRGPLAMEALNAVLASMVPYDDVRVVLGGFGEPVLHPQFPELLCRLGESGAYGIAIQTHGLGWNERSIQALWDHRVDVVNVQLDAATPPTYQRLHQADRLAEAIAFVERLMKGVSDRSGEGPLLCVQFTKCRENLQEMEAFVEGWHRRGVWPLVISPSRYAGQQEYLGLGSMSPTTRGPCRRIMKRTLVLADGRVAACDQDFQGQQALGRLSGVNLAEIWYGDAYRRLRASHVEGRFDGLAICPKCDEWDRP